MNGWEKPELNDEDIKWSILNPIDSLQLRELAEGK